MSILKVSTQAELNSAIEQQLKDRSLEIELHGSAGYVLRDSSQVRACGSSQVTACDSSQVTACGSSQVTACGSSQVRAYGSSQVRAYGSSQVTACDSSQVRAYDSSQVRAYGSSQVRAYGSSQVTACGSSQVTACGSSQVRACDSSQVRASKQVAVTIHGKDAKAKGGVQIKYEPPQTVKEWLANYGIDVKGGIAILFKGVQADFKSPHGTSYAPGTTPEAKDWDGGERECGGGLHFSPTPRHTLEFISDAKHFIACPVKVSEIVVHKNADMPQKVKAKRVFKPCYEVDINGKPIETKASVAHA